MKCSEEWRPVVGYEEYYEVSDMGRVRSPERMSQGTRGRVNVRSELILKLGLHRTNSWRVRFCVNKVKTSHSVHRLVAHAFIPNPENKPEVNHIDGNRLNNRLDNLEWCTKEENMRHAAETGLINNPFGKGSRNFHGTTVAYLPSGEEFGRYNGNKELTGAGFCFKLVSAVVNGKQKTHKGLTFKRLKEEK